MKLDSNWRRRRTIFRNVSWLFLTEWRIAPDNYATKHAWQAFQFHLYSKDANFVHVTGSISFQSLQLVLKNRIFEHKSNRKKQPKYPSMESHQHYWSLLFPIFLNKQENFTFLPDRRPSLSNTIVWKQNQGSSLKSTKIFIVYIIKYERRFDVSRKGSQASSFFPFLDCSQPGI